MAEKIKPTQKLATHTLTDLYYRDQNLVTDMMGKMSFTEAMIGHILNRTPTAADVAIIDAVLLALMEHGLTPSAVATRLTYHSAPEALQAAVAAGLLNVGSTFVGTMENCSKLLREMVEGTEPMDTAAKRIVAEHRAQRKHLPGFGHHLHKPDDPRTPKLFEIARANGVRGDYIRAIEVLSQAVDDSFGKHLTINATGGTAAVLSEIGIPPEIMPAPRALSPISPRNGKSPRRGPSGISSKRKSPTPAMPLRTSWTTVTTAATTELALPPGWTGTAFTYNSKYPIIAARNHNSVYFATLIGLLSR